MKFIVKKNIYTNEIVDIWDSLKECANDIGVKPPTILQAIKLHGKCKNYFFEYIYIPKEKIICLLKNE